MIFVGIVTAENDLKLYELTPKRLPVYNEHIRLASKFRKLCHVIFHYVFP